MHVLWLIVLWFPNTVPSLDDFVFRSDKTRNCFVLTVTCFADHSRIPRNNRSSVYQDVSQNEFRRKLNAPEHFLDGHDRNGIYLGACFAIDMFFSE